MANSRRRKNITWKSSSDVVTSSKELVPQRYVADCVISKDKHDHYTKHLVPGALWRINTEYFFAEDDSIYSSGRNFEKQNCYPYAKGYGWNALRPGNGVAHKKDDLIIYVGATRVEEMGKDRIISVLRHTFMINGQIYLVRRLEDLEPVE